MFNVVARRKGDAKAKGDDDVLLLLATRTFFEHYVNDNDRGSHVEELPDHVIATMISVAYGMTRGALFFKTSGTPYAGLLLPITSVSQLLKGTTLDDGGHERGI